MYHWGYLQQNKGTSDPMTLALRFQAVQLGVIGQFHPSGNEVGGSLPGGCVSAAWWPTKVVIEFL